MRKGVQIRLFKIWILRLWSPWANTYALLFWNPLRRRADLSSYASKGADFRSTPKSVPETLKSANCTQVRWLCSQFRQIWSPLHAYYCWYRPPFTFNPHLSPNYHRAFAMSLNSAEISCSEVRKLFHEVRELLHEVRQLYIFYETI